MGHFSNRKKHSHRSGMFYGGADEYGHTGRCYGRNKVFTKFVIIDSANNPIACFDTREAAIEAIDTLYPKNRIVERSFANFGQQEAFI